MKKKTLRPRSLPSFLSRLPSPCAHALARPVLAALAGALILAGCASTPAPGDARGGVALGEGISRLPALPPLPAPVAGPTVHAAVPEPVDPLRPDEKIDFDAAAAQSDLWMRVRRGFAMPDLDGDLVRDREQWYASRPDYVARMTGRASRYLFHIVEEIERRGMPTELALLPFVESAFNPQAMSTARASGMWQFIPSTGRDFLLTQNIFRDDRRDVLASTRAALDYLERLHGMFGDWHLALAAYNWGEGSVQRAIARNERAGLPTGYESLRMPDETRLYVPKLQAVKNLVARPETFGLALPAVANHPYFLSVPIDRDIDVELAARLAGISLEEFRTLNPQMKKPVILAAGTPQLLLPYDNANQFVKRLELHTGPLASWTAWVAPRTLRPAAAAREVGMTEDELREVNRIPYQDARQGRLDAARAAQRRRRRRRRLGARWPTTRHGAHARGGAGAPVRRVAARPPAAPSRGAADAAAARRGQASPRRPRPRAAASAAAAAPAQTRTCRRQGRGRRLGERRQGRRRRRVGDGAGKAGAVRGADKAGGAVLRVADGAAKAAPRAAAKPAARAAPAGGPPHRVRVALGG